MDFVVLCLLLKLSTEFLFASCNGNLLRLGCRAPHHNPAISIFLLVMLFKAPCSGNNGLLPCQQERCHMLFSLHTFSPWLCHCNQEPCHTCFFSFVCFFSSLRRNAGKRNLIVATWKQRKKKKSSFFLPASANCAKLLGQNHFAELNWHILTFSS